MITVEVQWLRDGLIEFVYRGDVTEADLVAAIERYYDLTEAMTPRAQLVDTLAVTSVPPSLGQHLGGLLDHYRDAGGRHVVMAAASHLNQMLGRSMSFGAGLKLALFESREEAMRHAISLVV